MSANFLNETNNFTGVKSFRAWCQKVLPSVYDDSLSYYELLCKVLKVIEEIIKDLDTLEVNDTGLREAYTKLENYVNNYFADLNVKDAVDNFMQGILDDGTLEDLIEQYYEKKTYYNVLNYDIVADGITDNIDAMNRLMKQVTEAGGGTIYFPAGKYNFSRTWFIGSFVTVCGDGYGTELYCTAPNHYGGNANIRSALCVVGNNVIVEDMRIEYQGGESTSWAGLDGENCCISVRCYDYPSIIREIMTSGNADFSLKESRYRVTINDIYTVSKFAIRLQSEGTDALPASQQFGIIQTDILNIHAPNGAIYLNATNSLGMNKVVVDNVDCTFFSEVGEQTCEVAVSNCFFNAAAIRHYQSAITNCKFILTEASPVLQWGILSNVCVSRGAQFTNCQFSTGGVAGVNGVLCQGYVNGGSGDLISKFTGCTFSNSLANSGTKYYSLYAKENDYVRAFISNSYVFNQSDIDGIFSSTIFTNNLNRKVSFEALNSFQKYNGAGGWWGGGFYPTTLEKNGSRLMVRLAYYRQTAISGQETGDEFYNQPIPILQITNTNAHPKSNKRHQCFILDRDTFNSEMGVVEISPDGVISVRSVSGKYPTKPCFFIDLDIDLY